MFIFLHWPLEASRAAFINKNLSWTPNTAINYQKNKELYSECPKLWLEILKTAVAASEIIWVL